MFPQDTKSAEELQPRRKMRPPFQLQLMVLQCLPNQYLGLFPDVAAQVDGVLPPPPSPRRPSSW